MYWQDAKAIEMAAKSLEIFMHSLPDGSRFNICGYGTDFEFLFDKSSSVEYNEKTLKKAIQDIETYTSRDRCLGGTDIFNPMKHIFDKKKEDTSMRRQIFLLTDGAVYNTEEIVKLIDSKAIATDSRVHTFGVGRGASTELIKEAASAGFGYHAFIEDPNQIEEKVMAALSQQYAPVKKIDEFTFLDQNGKKIKGVQSEVSDFFEGQLNLRNNNEINVSFISKNKDLMKVKSIVLKVYDPNTETYEEERVDVTVLPEDDGFGKIVG